MSPARVANRVCPQGMVGQKKRIYCYWYFIITNLRIEGGGPGAGHTTWPINVLPSNTRAQTTYRSVWSACYLHCWIWPMKKEEGRPSLSKPLQEKLEHSVLYHPSSLYHSPHFSSEVRGTQEGHQATQATHPNHINLHGTAEFQAVD